jgi:alpha-L-arabinofuranosidase
MLMQTIYYPFIMYAQRRHGVALQPVVKGPGYESASYGYVNDIDTSAILGEKALHVFLTNRNLKESALVEIHFPGGKLKELQSAEIVTGTDPNDRNTYEQPNLITNQPFQNVTIEDGIAKFDIQPLSFVAASFSYV